MTNCDILPALPTGTAIIYLYALMHPIDVASFHCYFHLLSSPHPSALFRPCLRPSERVPARSVPSKPPPAALEAVLTGRNGPGRARTVANRAGTALTGAVRSFDSCNSCKRLVPSRLHELHESKISVCFTYRIYPFETFEFFCSCIRGLFGRILPERPAAVARRRVRDDA